MRLLVDKPVSASLYILKNWSLFTVSIGQLPSCTDTCDVLLTTLFWSATWSRFPKNFSAILSRKRYSPTRAWKRVWTLRRSLTMWSRWPCVFPFSDSNSAVFRCFSTSSLAFYIENTKYSHFKRTNAKFYNMESKPNAINRRRRYTDTELTQVIIFVLLLTYFAIVLTIISKVKYNIKSYNTVSRHLLIGIQNTILS